ncbi:MAG: hypothetical protein J0H62_11170, partial [Rhizobiales bacterium]|nr:hypothetical protein [Hyphomicrobiales bacterium]
DRNLDVAFWTAAQAADHCEAMQAYMRRFPNGVFVELARLSERRLCAAKPDVAKSDVVPSAAAEIAAANEPAKAPDTGREATKIASVSEPAPASLPPAVAAAAAPAPAATAAAELARNAQLELIRLGCSDIEANGDWGDASRKAVRLFNKKVKAKLNIEKPNDALLAALRKKSDRVCPLVCESGFRAKGNTCVAVRSEPSRNAKRTTRQHQERPVAEQRRRARPVYQEAAPRQQPQSQPNIGAAVPVGIMLMHGMGGLRFR